VENVWKDPQCQPFVKSSKKSNAMSYEINLNGEQEKIEILNRSGNEIDVMVGDRKYHLDIAEVEHGVYSILLDGRIDSY